MLLPAETDERIWEYFATASMPDPEQVHRVLEVAADVGEPVTVPALESATGVRRGRLEALLRVVAVDGAVERVRSGWVATGTPYVLRHGEVGGDPGAAGGRGRSDARLRPGRGLPRWSSSSRRSTIPPRASRAGAARCAPGRCPPGSRPGRVPRPCWPRASGCGPVTPSSSPARCGPQASVMLPAAAGRAGSAWTSLPRAAGPSPSRRPGLAADRRRHRGRARRGSSRVAARRARRRGRALATLVGALPVRRRRDAERPTPAARLFAGRPRRRPPSVSTCSTCSSSTAR